MIEFESLIIEARKGDKAAEKLLFERLFVRFAAIAKQRLKEDYSEDIAQDACLTILEKYKTLPPETEFTPWAYQVLRNKIGNFLKNSRIRNDKVTYSENIEKLGGFDQSGTDPELKQKIVSCLKKLAKSNPNYLMIIDLKNQGFTTGEICQKMKINANHLYVLLHRCRTLLYQCIYNDGEME